MYDLAMIDGVVGQSDQRRSGRLGSPDRPAPSNTGGLSPYSSLRLILARRASFRKLHDFFSPRNLTRLLLNTVDTFSIRWRRRE